MNDNEVVIDILNANQRLDKFLLRQLNLSSRGFIYKMLRKKRIKLNGGKADGNEILKEGDIIRYYMSPETMQGLNEHITANPCAGKLNAIYEDNNIILANKPVGVLTHGTVADTDTMVSRALLHVGGKSADFAPVCVNRLDRNTSGIIIIAKNLPSAQWLAEALRERQIDKIYHAVVHGRVKDGATVNSALAKDDQTNKAYVSESGKLSVTSFEPIFSSDEYSVLSIRLVTGRTHQIRAHLSLIGHPIVGDRKYGHIGSLERKHGIDHQLLHCHSIKLNKTGGHLAYLSGDVFVCEAPQALGVFYKEG